MDSYNKQALCKNSLRCTLTNLSPQLRYFSDQAIVVVGCCLTSLQHVYHWIGFSWAIVQATLRYKSLTKTCCFTRSILTPAQPVPAFFSFSFPVALAFYRWTPLLGQSRPGHPDDSEERTYRINAHVYSKHKIGQTDRCPCDTAPMTSQHQLQDCPLHAAARRETCP